MFASLGLRDLVIVASCVAVFAVAVAQTAEKTHRPDHGVAGQRPPEPPFARIAKALDVPTERLHSAFRLVGPPSQTPLEPPSEQQLFAHSLKLAAALDVPADRVRSVMESFKPPRP